MGSLVSLNNKGGRKYPTNTERQRSDVLGVYEKRATGTRKNLTVLHHCPHFDSFSSDTPISVPFLQRRQVANALI